MKAIVQHKYGAPKDVLHLAEVTMPTVGAEDVLVSVRASSANPWDWHFIRGEPVLLRPAVLGEGTGGCDVEEDVRLPPAGQLRRPRRRWVRRAAGHHAAAGERRVEQPAGDHIEVTRLSLAQLPGRLRRRVLIRADCGGGTHDFLAWLARPGRRLAYSVGFTITDDIAAVILAIPDRVWEPAYDADGQVRPGAWVAEITGMLDLSSSPKGMRLIVCKERPNPGAKLRFTDPGGRAATLECDLPRQNPAPIRRTAQCRDSADAEPL